ncbi:MAG: radical SAM protein [Candidatus Sumerlaeaceae bacterium]|nr:radical SAM protein [Candidatus Sumerlaeaceae bacterium]
MPRYLRRKLHAALGKRGKLEDLYVFLTNQCNARCKHCFYIEELGYVPGELQLKDYERLAPTLPTLERIFFTGGEALLHPEVAEISLLLATATRARRTTLITNGFLPEKVEKYVERLLGHGLAGCVDVLVSLDGMEATHNEVRQNPRAWERANATLATLEQLVQRYGGLLDFGVITIITSRNWQELEELSDYLEARYPHARQGFEFVRGTHFSLWGLAPEFRADFNPPEDALPPAEVWDSILATLDKINRRRGLANHSFHLTTHFTVEMLRTKRKLFDCVSAGQNVAVLYPTGEIAVCEFSKPFGNIRDYGFDFIKAWNSPEAEAMRQATSRCWCTHGCYLSKNIEYSLEGLRAMLKRL